MTTGRLRLVFLILPAGIVFAAFFLLPLAQLFIIGAGGKDGLAAYAAIVTDRNYRASLFATLLLSAGVTVATLAISAIAGVFLSRNRFPFRKALVSMLTLPLAFPGVVIGFMVIMLAGRQGLVGDFTQWLTGEKLVFAYSMAGLFMGYVYFSIPRTILTLMAAAEKLDPRLEEAAAALGAPRWRVALDVTLPLAIPGLFSAFMIGFAMCISNFVVPLILGRGVVLFTTNLMYVRLTEVANYPSGAAIGLIMLALAIAVLYAMTVIVRRLLPAEQRS